MINQDNKWTEVQRLLDRFYEGATSRQEEQFLMECLTGEKVPDCFKSDAAVFRALGEESAMQHVEPEIPEGLEQRLMERIRQEESTLAPMIPIRPSVKSRRKWWMIAAACLLIAILSVPRLYHHHADDLFATSDITQQEAEEYADYALAMISTHLKTGMQELDEIGRVQEQIRASLSDISY